MPTFDLQGKKAMITGAGGGMGLAIAKGFLAAGANVAMIDVSPAIGDVAHSVDESGQRAFGIIGDLSKVENLEPLFQQALTALGGEVDILVNSAGITIRGDCATYPLHLWQKIMSINVDAMFFFSQLAAVEMMKKESGKIINLASMLSFFGSGASPAYATSKGAVAQMTKSMAIAWGAQGVCVNALAPGWVESALTTKLREDVAETTAITKRIPLNRWATPEDVVGPAIFLASQASDYINGVILPVDGGYLIC